jgi:hypothetical protein
MDFETLKTLGLWCIAVICVVNGLMLDLALGKFLASVTRIVKDFVREFSALRSARFTDCTIIDIREVLQTMEDGGANPGVK